MMTNDVTVLKFPLSRLSELAATASKFHHKAGEELTLNFNFENGFDFFKELNDPPTLGTLSWQIEKV